MSLKSPRSRSTNKNHLHRLVATNLIGVVFWTSNGTITDANDLFLRMFGYTREDMQQGHLCWESLLLSEERSSESSEKSAIVRQFATAPDPLEKEYLHRDGSRVPVLISGTFLDQEQSEGVTLVEDRSQKKELEQRKDT